MVWNDDEVQADRETGKEDNTRSDTICEVGSKMVQRNEMVRETSRLKRLKEFKEQRTD